MEHSLHKVLVNTSFTQSKSDYCLYMRESCLYTLFYVDNILIVSNNKTATNRVEYMFREHFDIDNLGPISNYLGIRVGREMGMFTIDQSKFILEVVRKFDLQMGMFTIDQSKFILEVVRKFYLQNSKNLDIPLSPTFYKQPKTQYLKSNENYRAAIECLLYILTNTR